jgi:hypothetical protein
MIMDRAKETQKAAEESRAASAETLTTHGTHSHIDDIPFIDEIAESAFIKGAEWADSHPQKADNNCKFCKQEEIITHKSKECDLSYDGENLCVDVDIPLTWGSATEHYRFSINYCSFCGRKLSE